MSSLSSEDDPMAAIDAMSYESARDALVQVVQTLESGGTTLDESMTLWTQGEKLVKRCQFHLDGAQAQLDSALNTQGESGE